MDAITTLIGLDVGSFKTAITASNGRRAVLPSIVGRPVDANVRDQLGREVLLGNEVARNRVPMEIEFPFRRSSLCRWDVRTKADPGPATELDHAAELLLEHALQLVQPEMNAPIYATLTIPAAASANYKHALLRSARSVFDAVMLSSAPFCVAYGSNQLAEALIIDIGASSTNLCVLTNSAPTTDQQLTLPVGSDSIDLEILRGISASLPGTELSLNTARRIKEKFGCVPTEPQTAMVATTTSGPEMDLAPVLRQACRSIVPDIVDAVGQLLSSIESIHRTAVLQNITLAGGGGQLKDLVQVLQSAFSEWGQVRIQCVPDAAFAAATGALRLAESVSMSDWNRLALSTAGFVKPARKAA